MTECKRCGLKIHTNKSQRDAEHKRICQPCVNLAENSDQLYVSPLERDDLEIVLAWRSNPEIYRYFREQNSPLSWKEHIEWFESRNSDRYDFMIHYEDRRVGVISLSSDREVTIYLGDFSVHDEGIATRSLNWLCERFNHKTPIYAEVHKDNMNSIHLFQSCGFRVDAETDSWKRYKYSD
jgi:RimJ/RimL family protein N-acetyltransferase